MIKNLTPFVIPKEYPTFQDFFKNEQSQIYFKIIEAFEQVVQSNDDNKTLVIIAKVKDTTFDTKFEINKNNAELLTETINPYFEKLEEYEACNRIRNLCVKLKKN